MTRFLIVFILFSMLGGDNAIPGWKIYGWQSYR